MGKLNFVVEDASRITRLKNEEEYKEIAAFYNTLELGKAFTVKNEDVPSLSLLNNIRKFVVDKPGEHLRLTKLERTGTEADGDKNGKIIITGIKLSKVIARSTDEAGTDSPSTSEVPA